MESYWYACANCPSPQTEVPILASLPPPHGDPPDAPLPTNLFHLPTGGANVPRPNTLSFIFSQRIEHLPSTCTIYLDHISCWRFLCIIKHFDPAKTVLIPLPAFPAHPLFQRTISSQPKPKPGLRTPQKECASALLVSVPLYTKKDHSLVAGSRSAWSTIYGGSQ